MGEAPIGEARVAREECRGFAWVADDEVDSGVCEVFVDEGEGAFGEREGVAAAHGGEDIIVEGLEAHRDAIDALRGKGLEEVWRDIERVQFDGEFCLRREIFLECGEERREVAESGRAAAEIDGVERGRERERGKCRGERADIVVALKLR